MENNQGNLHQQQPRYSKRGRALSPSRLLVLETLESQSTPVTLPALVRRVKLHENTVRGHLNALLRDGAITHESAPAEGRGRPQLLWSATKPEATTAAAHEYVELATVLAKTISMTAPDPLDASLRAGRSWGEELVTRGRIPALAPHTSDHEHVAGFLNELGFAPQTHTEPLVTPIPHHSVIELHRCPLLDAAAAHPDVVCNVHLGLIQGALEHQGIDATGSTLEAFTAPGVCTLDLVTRRSATETEASA